MLAEAMGHPVRAKLLFAVSEKSESGVTIRELAERIGEPKRKVRYHLDAMVESGLVAIADERDRRGVVERLFRAEQMPFLGSEAVDELADDTPRQMSVQILKAILADASAAVRANCFGMRSGHSAIRLPGEVDGQGWNELARIYDNSLVEVQAVISRSRERLEVSGEVPIVALNALLLFEVPPWPS